MNADAQRARSIFLRAVEERQPDQWDAYLDKTCGNDAVLRQRVGALLQAHVESNSLLDAPANAFFAAADRPIAERPGAVIGPYKLSEQIGEGGFGVVFMVEQQQPIRRKVALKLLKPGMDTRQVVARFEAERQALALMDHPNIAHVFDGGTTETGRPYFVMELVRGVPITEFCDESSLSIRQRLELFVDVCHAVQHAHQKGIIHRDIKPTNVLVTLHDGRPVVKVIDFGIAKAMGLQLTEKTLYTNFAQIIGTPLYMSPEQAEMSGLDVDTRSDIYSLGVLLYELLTGTTPFENERLRQVGYDEMRRIIREEEPPKPSTRISTVGKAATTASEKRQGDPRQLSKLFRGELDWIVMKALEKDRDRRYETASALDCDVRHYLQDEPVQACPPSAAYRLRKFARKHRNVLRLAAAFVWLLTTATSVSGWMAFRAMRAELATGRERDRAEAEAKRAQGNFEIAKEAVDDFLNKVTEDRDLKRSDFNGLRKKLLESAVPFYQRLVEQKQGDATQEAARGHAYGRLGDLRRQVGETAGALTDFEQRRSIFSRLAASIPTVPEYRDQVATSHDCLGNALFELRRNEEAETAYRAALAIQEKLVADFPTVPEYRDNLAKTRTNLGVLRRRLGRRHEAEADIRAALAIRERLAADFPTEPEYRASLAGNRYDLGDLLRSVGRRDEAEAACHAALAIREKLARDFPTIPQYRDNLGALLDQAGKPDEAEAAYRAALPIQEKLAADFPTIPQFRERLAGTHNSLGVLLARLGKRDEAEASFRAALAIREKLTADFPTVAKYRDYLARGHNNLGSLLDSLDRRDEAEAACRAALAIRERLASDFPTEPEHRELLAATRTNLGALLTRKRRRDEAEAAYRAALAIYERLAVGFPTLPEYRKNLAAAHVRLGSLLAAVGKRDEAEAAERAARVILEQLADDFPTVPEYGEMLAWTACQFAFLAAKRRDRSSYRECCDTMLLRSERVTDPVRAWALVRACLLLEGGVPEPRRLAPLVQTAGSLDQKHELYQWVLFAQGLHEYRCGRFAEARTASANSRERATFPAVVVMARTLEAMSLYRLVKTDEARQALAAANRLFDEKESKLDNGELDGIWYDWQCCRILRREAEEMLKQPATDTRP